MTFGEIAVLVVAVLVVAAAIYFRKKPQALQAAEQSVQDAFKSGVQHASDIIAQHTQHTVSVINATSNAIASNQPQMLPHVVTNAEKFGSRQTASYMGLDPDAPFVEKPIAPVDPAPAFTDFRDFPGRAVWTDRDPVWPPLTVKDTDKWVNVAVGNNSGPFTVTLANEAVKVDIVAPDKTLQVPSELPPGRYNVTCAVEGGRAAVEFHFG